MPKLTFHSTLDIWEYTENGISGFGKTPQVAFSDWQTSAAYNSLPPFSLDSHDELRKAALSNGQP